METNYCDQMYTVDGTYFYDNSKNPSIVKKELSLYIILDTIRVSIINQHLHTFGVKPHEKNLEMLVNGFVLFNLHKNKNMLNSKNDLLKYIKNRSISLEEKEYFMDIFLYNQRPAFLTFNEHEYIRACGDLDGFVEE
jgi:hypothetical protein